MVCRTADFLRAAEILPPDPGQSAIVLQVRVPPQDRSLELGCGHRPELLPERAIRTQLEL